MFATSEEKSADFEDIPVLSGLSKKRNEPKQSESAFRMSEGASLSLWQCSGKEKKKQKNIYLSSVCFYPEYQNIKTYYNQMHSKTALWETKFNSL